MEKLKSDVTQRKAALKKLFVGHTVKRIRPMTPNELEDEGWAGERPAGLLVIELDNGAKLFASRDDEGNGPGRLFGKLSDGLGVYVTPED